MLLAPSHGREAWQSGEAAKSNLATTGAPDPCHGAKRKCIRVFKRAKE